MYAAVLNLGKTHDQFSNFKVYLSGFCQNDSLFISSIFGKFNEILNLKFEIVSQIKDSNFVFKYDETLPNSSCYVGKENIFNGDDPCMKINNILDFKHEFGHFLGMEHEHQNWDLIDKLKLNKEKILIDLKKSGIKNVESFYRINFEINKNPRSYNTSFDEDSIMSYFIPPEYQLNNPKITFKKNIEFSETDIEILKSYYPKNISNNNNSLEITWDYRYIHELNIIKIKIKGDYSSLNIENYQKIYLIFYKIFTKYEELRKSKTQITFKIENKILKKHILKIKDKFLRYAFRYCLDENSETRMGNNFYYDVQSRLKSSNTNKL